MDERFDVFSDDSAILKEWKMGNDKIPKTVYVGECVGSHLGGQPRKR